MGGTRSIGSTLDAQGFTCVRLANHLRISYEMPIQKS